MSDSVIEQLSVENQSAAVRSLTRHKYMFSLFLHEEDAAHAFLLLLPAASCSSQHMPLKSAEGGPQKVSG